MTDNYEIDILIDQANSFMKSNNYSPKTINMYQYIWKQCSDVSREEMLQYFSYDVLLPFMISKWINIEHQYTCSYQCTRLRALRYLDNIKNYDSFQMNCKCKPLIVSEILNPEILSIYLESMVKKEFKLSTIRNRIFLISHFLHFAYEFPITNISEITFEHISQYLKYLNKSHYAPSSKALYISSLRKYFKFLYENSYISQPYFKLISGNIYRNYTKLPSNYTETEVKKLLSVVDRSSCLGQRDYLVLLLATILGMRAHDLTFLKLENINWENKSISFIQSKTGISQTLPITAEIKYALIDYLKNSRPCHSSPYIFLMFRAPHSSYRSSNPFYRIIKKYMILAGIDYSDRKHGLHSMRHSLATNLLNKKNDYPVISGILGHVKTSSTMTYTSISIEQLRNIALEVPYER